MLYELPVLLPSPSLFHSGIGTMLRFCASHSGVGTKGAWRFFLSSNIYFLIHPSIFPSILFVLLLYFLSLSVHLLQSKAKAVTGEGSIDFSQYKRALSKTSSSGSSYEALPGTKRSTSRDESLFELSEQRDKEVTQLTERLSSVEGEKEQLRKEKEKLERKLNEAEQVAAQADVAVTEVLYTHI